jgi:hypothetical protein
VRWLRSSRREVCPAGLLDHAPVCPVDRCKETTIDHWFDKFVEIKIFPRRKSGIEILLPA